MNDEDEEGENTESNPEKAHLEKHEILCILCHTIHKSGTLSDAALCGKPRPSGEISGIHIDGVGRGVEGPAAKKTFALDGDVAV